MLLPHKLLVLCNVVVKVVGVCGCVEPFLLSPSPLPLGWSQLPRLLAVLFVEILPGFATVGFARFFIHIVANEPPVALVAVLLLFARPLVLTALVGGRVFACDIVVDPVLRVAPLRLRCDVLAHQGHIVVVFWQVMAALGHMQRD